MTWYYKEESCLKERAKRLPQASEGWSKRGQEEPGSLIVSMRNLQKTMEPLKNVAYFLLLLPVGGSMYLKAFMMMFNDCVGSKPLLFSQMQSMSSLWEGNGFAI